MPRPPDAAAIAEILGRSKVFEAVPLDERMKLATTARTVRCEGRTLVQAADEAPQEIFLVVSGQAELSSGTREGEEVTIALFGPGCWVTWLAVFDLLPTGRDCHATNGSSLLAFPRKAIQAVLERHPAAYPIIIREISIRFRALLRWQEHLTLSDRDHRVAKMLLLLASVSGDTSQQPSVRMSHERLATTAGCSRQSLFSSLKKLSEQGLIQQGYGRIILSDLAGLGFYATGS